MDQFLCIDIHYKGECNGEIIFLMTYPFMICKVMEVSDFSLANV